MKEKKVYRILAIDDDESILRLIKNSLAIVFLEEKMTELIEVLSFD